MSAKAPSRGTGSVGDGAATLRGLLTPPIGPVTRAWREIERAWIGYEHAPLDERVERAGWWPDGVWAYCPRCGRDAGPGEVVPREVPSRAAHAGRARGGPGTRAELACAACEGEGLLWDRSVRLGRHEGLLRELVHEIKFARRRDVGVRLGRALGALLLESGARAGVVVPVPVTWRRRWSRGVDHARAIARGVSHQTGWRLVPALERRHRPPQTSLSAGERRRNLRGSMSVRAWVEPGRDLGIRAGDGRAVLVLVDDVRTTGATLHEGCRALREWAGRKGPAPGRSGNDPSGTPAGERLEIWAAVLSVAQDSG